MTEKIPFTRESVTAALEAAVDLKGEDYVYRDEACRYFAEDGSPRCIVGYVLQAHGWTLRDIKFSNSQSATSLFTRLVAPDLDTYVRFALNQAQAAQDGNPGAFYRQPRQTWGEALRAYREALGVAEAVRM